MKAFVYKKYGPPEILELTDVEKPIPKENEVLVQVHAVSINDWDFGLLLGTDLINRIINGLTKPRIKILGSDVAGRVEAVGKNVKQFKSGDKVYGDLSGHWGGFAQYVCARENELAFKPPGMTFEQAASIPQAAQLALQGLLEGGKLESNQKVLINGAGGGVGTFGIQIAKQYGMEVTGVDSSGKLDMMRSLGFEHVIDYTKQDFTKNDRQYDLILDVKTNRSIFRYLRALNPGGIYVTVGGSIFRLLQAFILSPLIKLFYKKKVSVVALKQNQNLDYFNELFEAGKMRPVIDGPYNLDDLPKAFRLFSQGDHKGKIVITMKNQ